MSTTNPTSAKKHTQAEGEKSREEQVLVQINGPREPEDTRSSEEEGQTKKEPEKHTQAEVEQPREEQVLAQINGPREPENTDSSEEEGQTKKGRNAKDESSSS